METVYIAVMDYRDGSIKLYEKEFPKGYQGDDVESWLNENTDYSDSMCYYMSSSKPIDIIRNDEE